MPSLDHIGLAVVVIGRNEGERLRACLASLLNTSPVALIVYVDSGSTDGSVELAESMGCLVHALDLRKPFTAARARNEGANLAKAQLPSLLYLQFVDGDCEVMSDWLPSAIDFLTKHPKVAVVCGRRRERFPDKSIFNRLCDIEWDTPVGRARSCGGDALVRAEAFFCVDGYRPGLIAGEEPELCVRLRANDWEVWRLGLEMTLHDAAMYRFSQWWSRSKRAGHAFAEGAHLHGKPPERHYKNELNRAIFWGGLLPIVVFIGSLWSPIWLTLLLLYPLQAVRIALRGGSFDQGLVWTRAWFLVLAKFPECLGALRFWKNQLSGKAGTLIEYK